MVFCSVLIPFIESGTTEPSELLKEASAQLGTPPNTIELYALVLLSEAVSYTSIAISLKSNVFSMDSIEELLNKQKTLSYQLVKCKETLHSLILHTAKHTNVTESRVTRRVERLKSDNKRLRELLKTQLENSELLRQETQQTVETLREEFDKLVQEITPQKGNVESLRKSSHPRKKLK